MGRGGCRGEEELDSQIENAGERWRIENAGEEGIGIERKDG